MKTFLPALILTLAVGLPAFARKAVMDSRLVINFVAPDQESAAENCKVDWGHYYQHKTNHGTLRQLDANRPGVWISAVFNVNNPKVDWTYVTHKGQGSVSFSGRAGNDDGRRAGYVDPESCTAWTPLQTAGGGRFTIPAKLDGKPYIQLRVTLEGGARVQRIEIHKNITLPDHPRIFVTAEIIARTKKRIAADAKVKEIFDRYIQGISGRMRWGNMRSNKNTWLCNAWATSTAIAWRLTGDRKFLDEAKAQIVRADSDWGRKRGHFDRPVLLEGLSAAFDIIYNDLTDAERKRFGKALLEMADVQQHKAWLFSDMSNQAYVNGATPMFIGIALAGEPEFKSDPRVQNYWRYAEDRIRLHILPATNGWAKDDGGWGEGHGYFGFTSGPLMRELMAWSTATGEDVYEDAGVIRHLSHWRVYERRPWSGAQAKFNDSGKGSVGMPMPAFIAMRYRDRHAQKLAADSLKKDPSDFAAVRWWKHVVWYDPKLEPATSFDYSGTSLPLGRYFEGVGHVVCREGWDKGGTWAVFKSGPYWTGNGSHTHGDENSFMIDRKGSLAIDSGTDTSPRRSHYRNYFLRTIAHNTMTVFVPGEKFPKTQSNDGGQFGGTFNRLRGGKFDSAQWGAFSKGRELALDGVVAFQTNEHYTYACGDAAKAYSRDKVSEFTREFVFVQPGSFIVFDRVTSKDASYKKTWLLHGINKPTLRGRRFTFQHDKGKLVTETLLPARAKIETVGGPKKEFWINGKNYPIDGSSKSGNWDAGAWRVEVSPPKAARRDLFCHVLHALDADVSVPARAKLTQNAKSVTVRFYAYGRNVTVTFNKGPGIGGRLKVVKGGEVLVDKPLERKTQPQRFDPDTIWK